MLPSRIYHCLYKEPEGDALKPTCIREVNGKEDTYLFAATVLTKALAFSFSYHNGEAVCNGGIEGTPDEWMILCGGQETIKKPRHIRVYDFPSDGFEEIKDARQCVSRNSVPFSRTRLIFETRDIDDIMRAGLQIFVLKDEIHTFCHEQFYTETDFMNTEQMLGHIWQTGRAQLLNNARNINASPVLLDKMIKHTMITPDNFTL